MIPYTNLAVFEETQYVDTDEHPFQKETFSNSGIVLVGHDEYPPLFSQKKRILELDDEMWIHPCNNKNDWTSKKLLKIFENDEDKDEVQ